MKRFFNRREPAARRLEVAVRSGAGTYAINEDFAATSEVSGCTLLALADGLGGHEQGEVASRLAVERAVDAFRRRPATDARTVEQIVRAAHQTIRTSANAHNPRGLRTTLTILAAGAESARWAHVGDSRAYHFRAGVMQSRTRDHSVPELLHRMGEIQADDIRHHPDRNRLLQALGQDTEPRITIGDAVELLRGDAFLLCTDGWWEVIADGDMQTSLERSRTPLDWLDRMCARIVAAGSNPQDNYTAIAAFVH